jgi:hypothetical protein
LQGLGYFIDQPLLINLSHNNFSYLFALVVFSVVILKPVLESRYKSQSEVKELRKFKRSFAVLNFYQKLEILSGFDKLEGLHFGNSVKYVLTIFLVQIVVIVIKHLKRLLTLVHEFPEKSFLNILFNINPENNENFRQSLRVYFNKRFFQNKIEEAITDWHIHKMIELWSKKAKMQSL